MDADGAANNSDRGSDERQPPSSSSSTEEAPTIAVDSEAQETNGSPAASADFLCGWLNVWAIDGSRSANDIFNESAPSPYYPDWEPLFAVFSIKTGQLSHFLTEQYAEEFYRFADNVSLLASTRSSCCSQQERSVDQDAASLRPAVTRRLDGGRAAFMARWGLESLENLRSKFGATSSAGLSAAITQNDRLLLDDDNNIYNDEDIYDESQSSNFLLSQSARSERIRLQCNNNNNNNNNDVDDINHLKSPSAFSTTGTIPPASFSNIGSPLTSTAQKSHERPLSVLRRDISCSMDVLYFKSLQPGADQSSTLGSSTKGQTLGKFVTPSRPPEPIHVRRPSFRHLKAFLNQHSLTAIRHGSTANASDANGGGGGGGWGPFSGLKIRRAKSQAKLQNTTNTSINSSVNCISSTVGLGLQSTTPDRWRQPYANSTALEGGHQQHNSSNNPSRPSSSLFGSQLTMTTIDMNDPDSVHIRPVHPTLLSGHCFQVNSTNSPQTHFYACKSPAEGRAWLWELSNYSLASMPFNSPSPTVPSLSNSGSVMGGFGTSSFTTANNNNNNNSAMQQSMLSSKSSYQQSQPQPRAFPVANGRTRMVNTLKLSVLEAVNLPQKYKYYCDIYIDDVLYARTTSKHRHELLFWGENFEFAQLPAVQFVQLKLYREAASSTKKRSGKEKNSLLGSVSVPIADISGRQLIDRWYPISVESKIRRRIFGQRNSTVVNVRIRGRYQSTVVLPQPNYRDLINFVSSNYSWMVESLEPAIPLRLKDELASCLVHILQSRGLVVDFLVSAALSEVARTSSDNEALAFRGNSIASKAFECYMKLVGERYLFDMLSGFVQAVSRSCDDCEVDSAKLQASNANNNDSSASGANNRNLDRNRFNLVSYCEMVWRKVLQSAAWFPPELRAVFAEIRHNLSAKPMLCDNIISACVFLRFLCPAILSPSLFGLCQEYPEERASRTFTLVAKTIQSLANFARFGTKEDYMSFMNSFVEREAGNVRQFLLNISSQQQEQFPNANQTSSFGLNNGPFIDTAYHSSLLHDVLCECISFLPKLTASRGDRHDSPRSDENDLAHHLELQAILDRLTEDLGSASLHHGSFAAMSTQTLPNSRPQIPSIVAYDNLCFPNGGGGANAVARDALFNTFPHKMQPASQQEKQHPAKQPNFVQPATVIPAPSAASRSKSVAPSVSILAAAPSADSGVNVNDGVVNHHQMTTSVRYQQPGSSCTLSPSVYRRHSASKGAGSTSSSSADRRGGHQQQSPSVWQTLPTQPTPLSNTNNRHQLAVMRNDSPERELEKSWNQLIAAAEMLSVDSASNTMPQSLKSNSNTMPSSAPRHVHKQPKMGTGVDSHSNSNSNNSPTTRFSTLTSGYQSSSLSSSNSNSPIQSTEFNVNSGKKKQQQVPAATPDYSIISAHEIFPAPSATASLPTRSSSNKVSIDQLETPVGPSLTLEDSGNDDVFHHPMAVMHSPLINSVEMTRLIGTCDVESRVDDTPCDDQRNHHQQLLMVNGNSKRSPALSSASSSSSRDSHLDHSTNGMAKSMFVFPGGRNSIGGSSGSEGDSNEVTSVLDNLAHLEAQLKQEHAALSKSSADRQWLLENGQRCVGSLLDALTKLRRHCEQITSIESSTPTNNGDQSSLFGRSFGIGVGGAGASRQTTATAVSHQSPPNNNGINQRPAHLALATTPNGSAVVGRKESHL